MVYTLLKNIEFFSFINNLFYLLSGSFLVLFNMRKSIKNKTFINDKIFINDKKFIKVEGLQTVFF